jgi:phosphoesterase RecJ-like protein
MRELGVDIPQIYKDTLATHTITSFKLRVLANDRLEFLEDGKVTFTYINKKDEEKVNAEIGDYEGIVNEGRNLEGVEVSIFLHQTEKGYKASLRSNSYVNVSEICGKFGGGGHVRAAGVTFTEGTPKQIKEQLVEEIKKYLK